MIPVPLAPLFVPGDRPDRFAKAAATEADAVIIDLEDAVDPDVKVKARSNIAAHGISGKPVFVRVNAAGSPWWDDDLKALSGVRLDAVMIPKAESPADVRAVAAAAGPGAAIMVLVETGLGLSRLREILKEPQVLCAGFGSLDFGLDVGCEPTWEPLLSARSEVVLASRLAGIGAPIDGVTPSFDDAALVEAETRRARAMGFGGKLAIHPKQVAPIRAAFLPSEADLAWARRILEAAVSDAAIKVDGQMIDKPLVERARRIVAAAGGGA